jgi:uncharacterized protein YegJ (DUF2314 family)
MPIPAILTENVDEAAMKAAIVTARGRVDEFIRVLNEKLLIFPFGESTDQEGREHRRLLDHRCFLCGRRVHRQDRQRHGILTTVTYCQKWQVKKEEISDWMYILDERIHGGFTIAPLLGSQPKEQANAMRARLAG